MIPPPRASSVPVSAFEAGFEGAFSPSAIAGGSEFDDEAQPAFPVSPGSSSADDAEGPPLDELEAQMRGELAARDVSTAASPAARRTAAATGEDSEADIKSGPLPELDALVARLPAEVRETLDELFRARFVAVKRLPKRLLQPARSKGSAPASGNSSSPTQP